MAREFRGKIPKVPIDADISMAEEKIDKLLDKVNGLQDIKIDASISNIQRKLETLVKRTNQQMTTELVSGAMKDFKQLMGAMKTEFDKWGTTDIYKSMEKTYNMVESRFSNLTVGVDQKSISGLANILNEVTDFSKISNFTFDGIISDADVKKTEKVVENIEAASRAIRDIRKRAKNDSITTNNVARLETRKSKLETDKQTLNSFLGFDDQYIRESAQEAINIVDGAIANVEARIRDAQDFIQSGGKTINDFMRLWNKTSKNYAPEDFGKRYGDLMESISGETPSMSVTDAYKELERREAEHTKQLEEERKKRMAIMAEIDAFNEAAAPMREENKNNANFTQEYTNAFIQITHGSLTAAEAIKKLRDTLSEVIDTSNQVQQEIQETTEALKEQENITSTVTSEKAIPTRLASEEYKAAFGNGKLDEMLSLFNIKGNDAQNIIDKFNNLMQLNKSFATNLESKSADQINVETEAIQDALNDITSEFIKSGSIVVATNDKLKEFYDYINNGKQIRYNDNQRGEFGDSWSTIKKKNNKLLTTKVSGIPVDVLWEELVDAFPEFFDREMSNEADQLKTLLNVVQQARDSKKDNYKIMQQLSESDRSGIYKEVATLNLQAQDALYEEMNSQQKLIEGEQQVKQAVEETTRARERGVEITKEAARATSEETFDEDLAKNIIEKDIDSALQQLREATNNEETLINFKGAFTPDNLREQFEAFARSIDGLDLKVGSINIDGDTARVQLYNDELKTTVNQTWKLKEASEETGTTLEFMGQSYRQNIKALSDNNFDVEGIRARAEAAVKKLKASLHDVAYDLTDLETAAGNIGSQDDFNKFNNQLKAAKDNIQALKSATVTKSSMDQLANMQRDMKNANIELDTMELKLKKVGDVEGLSDAEETIKNMRSALEEFNKATEAESQQAAYNKYSDLRSTFKAQLQYLNAFKSVNPPVTEESSDVKNIDEYYNNILDSVKKITELDTQINNLKLKDGGTGIYDGMIAQLESEKSTLLNKIDQIGQDINQEFNEAFTSVGDIDKIQIPLGTFLDDTSASSTLTQFFNDVEVRAALTIEQVNAFVQTLKKSQNTNFEFGTKIASQFNDVYQAVNKLQALSAEGKISQDSAAYQNVTQAYERLLAMQKEFGNNTSKWSATQVAAFSQATKQVINYSNEIAKAAEKEASYFSGMSKYSSGSSMNDTFAPENTASSSNNAKKNLEKFVAEFTKGQGVVTNFVTAANGINRIDFSALDEQTGQFRTFSAELGQFTNNIYYTETSMKNLSSGTDAAKKDLTSLSDMIAKLSGIDGADDQIQKLWQTMQTINSALSEVGDSKDVGTQTMFKNLHNEAQKSEKDAAKLLAAWKKTQEAILNGDASSLGQIDKYGNIQEQMYQKIKESADGASISNQKFDDVTNTLTYTITDADGAITEMSAHMDALTGTVTTQQGRIGQLKSGWQELGSSLSSAGKQLANYAINAIEITALIGYLRQGFTAVKEIDAALTELKKVTDETSIAYENFLKTTSKTAGTIGSTVSDFTEATANFARLGYTMEESADMAKTAIVYKNVADGLDTVEESTDSIISTMMAFGIEADNTMSIADKFNEVGNKFSITSAGIGEALQRSAAALEEGGNTIDESIGLITAANSVIQNPERVGE